MTKISTLTSQKSKWWAKKKNTFFEKVYQYYVLCNVNIFMIIHQKNNNQYFIFNSDFTRMFSLLDMILLSFLFNHYVINTEKNNHSIKTLKNFKSIKQSWNFNDFITCKFFSSKKMLNTENHTFNLIQYFKTFCDFK